MRAHKVKNASRLTPRLSPEEDRGEIRRRFEEIRQTTEEICRPLEVEDYGVQSMPDVSPPKWHLAHTSWFFETFLLIPHLKRYKPFHPQFQSLFNSYYESLGNRHPRPERGLLSRPTVNEVYQYRTVVEEGMGELILSASEKLWEDIQNAVELGLNHEQQHQELLLTDIKHILYSNPLRPVYQKLEKISPCPKKDLHWIEFPEGIRRIGYGGDGFSFDNERPRHRVFLEPYRLASRLTTNGEYTEFIGDGGYQDPSLWLSEGWDWVQSNSIEGPLYWEKEGGRFFTLSGTRPVDPDEPICHVSFYEAEAFARWAGKRLPIEAEWENGTEGLPVEGNLLESKCLHPKAAPLGNPKSLSQIFGDVWEWTRSSYSPYPGFKPTQGAFEEYNGKFMCSQMVLRGGSCVTAQSHLRPTYRNFFYPKDRWQFTGIRLAEDV
jgi:ergothioneine biosynthesis protein EgtB